MKTSIKIVKIPDGRGDINFGLQVDGLYIHKNLDGSGVKAIENELGVPAGTTNWCGLWAVRKFWNEDRDKILESLKTPYLSVWGTLVLASEMRKPVKLNRISGLLWP